MSGLRLRLGMAVLLLGAAAAMHVSVFGPGPATVSEHSTVGMPERTHAALVTDVHSVQDHGLAGCVGVADLTVFPAGGQVVSRAKVHVFVDIASAQAYQAAQRARTGQAPPVAFFPDQERCPRAVTDATATAEA